jgi:hypothetical protein
LKRARPGEPRRRVIEAMVAELVAKMRVPVPVDPPRRRRPIERPARAPVAP